MKRDRSGSPPSTRPTSYELAASIDAFRSNKKRRLSMVFPNFKAIGQDKDSFIKFGLKGIFLPIKKLSSHIHF